MKMTYEKLNKWINGLAKTKFYTISLKNGRGFYEIMYLYHDYHHIERIYPHDMEDELKCQKKILDSCIKFERNTKPLNF